MSAELAVRSDGQLSQILFITDILLPDNVLDSRFNDFYSIRIALPRLSFRLF